jgi:hypothetical protein
MPVMQRTHGRDKVKPARLRHEILADDGKFRHRARHTHQSVPRRTTILVPSLQSPGPLRTLRVTGIYPKNSARAIPSGHDLRAPSSYSRVQFFLMGRSLILNRHEAMAEVKGRRFARVRPKTHEMKDSSGVIEVPLHQRGAHAVPTCGPPDVEVSQASDHAVCDVGVAIEPAHAEEVVT